MTIWSKTGIPVAIKELRGMFILVDEVGARIDWPAQASRFDAEVDLKNFKLATAHLRSDEESEARGLRFMSPIEEDTQDRGLREAEDRAWRAGNED